MTKLVSVITPMYNSEKFISSTLDSILSQSYSNLEIIVVDDLSTDKSPNIVQEYVLEDRRVKYFLMPQKGGASQARNLAISKAKGDYIAFLDADDIWDPSKLEKQVKFMEENDFAFTFTFYDEINENGEKTGLFRTSPLKLEYKDILKRLPFGCLTVMYDSAKVGKVSIPRIDKRNDYALWLKIMRSGVSANGLPEILSSYRLVDNSLSRSSSKMSLLKYYFKIFYEFEHLGLLKSVFYTLINVINFIRYRFNFIESYSEKV